MLGDLQHSLDVAEPEGVVRIDEKPLQARGFVGGRRRRTRVAVRASPPHLGDAGGQRQIASPSRSVAPRARHGKRHGVALGGLATTKAGWSLYITHAHAPQPHAPQREVAALCRPFPQLAGHRAQAHLIGRDRRYSSSTMKQSAFLPCSRAPRGESLPSIPAGTPEERSSADGALPSLTTRAKSRVRRCPVRTAASHTQVSRAETAVTKV